MEGGSARGVEGAGAGEAAALGYRHTRAAVLRCEAEEVEWIGRIPCGSEEEKK
jgi:hypothetical protein